MDELYGPVTIGAPCKVCGVAQVEHAGKTCEESAQERSKALHALIGPALKAMRETYENGAPPRTFYDRNPAARPFQSKLIEMRSQEHLLRNAFWVLRDMRKWRGLQLWTLVGAITGHGSGYSQQICEELGWDYEMKITPAARLPDRKSDAHSAHE